MNLMEVSMKDNEKLKKAKEKSKGFIVFVTYVRLA